MQPHKEFYDHIDVSNSFRSIIVLNGQIPDLAFFQSQNLPIIAADGAANKLMAMGLKPNLVIGDLDSIHPHLLSQLDTVHLHDQDYCDFHKTINHLQAINLLPSIITGIEGGMIDHILQNINIFVSTNSIFYAPPVVGYILRSGEDKRFNLPANTKISLFGMPATVTTQGLKWELNKHELTFPGTNSSFNRSANSLVSIEIHKGCCLVMIYLDGEKDAGLDYPLLSPH